MAESTKSDRASERKSAWVHLLPLRRPGLRKVVRIWV